MAWRTWLLRERREPEVRPRASANDVNDVGKERDPTPLTGRGGEGGRALQSAPAAGAAYETAVPRSALAIEYAGPGGVWGQGVPTWPC